MLSVFAMVMGLQQAAGPAVVWETPAPVAEAGRPVELPVSHLPAWALADPFAWERSQCSPIVRREPSLETCQARVRGELHAALGDRLPAGLLPANAPVPCLATPGEGGDYPVQCGLPERRGTVAVATQAPDCQPRPTRQGGSLAFVTDCRTDPVRGDQGGLSFRLGKD